MLKTIKTICYSLLLVVLLIPIKVNAFQNDDYYIKSYNVNIIVNEDNSFDITEKIVAYFINPKHGIERNIPTRNNIERLDKTHSLNRAKVSNLTVNEEYTTTKSNGSFNVKIGNKDITLTGEKEYIISYKYSLSGDKTKEYDELYFNIIGSRWDTSISNITFNITMPKEFDTSKIGFSSGRYGSTDNSNVIYNVVGNTIAGRYNGTLNSREALTIRCELPEGYFTTTNDYLFTIIATAICAFSVLISFLLWLKNGRDPLAVETVEFYPPDDLNSCELDYVLAGKSSKEGAISLLLYLASKGYLKIEEREGNGLIFKKKDFKITKLKEYDGNNLIESIFFNGLFSCAKVMNDYVTASDLYDEFYKTITIVQKTTENELTDVVYSDNRSYNSIFKVLVFIIISWIVFSIMSDYSIEINSKLFLIIPGLLILAIIETFILTAYPFEDPRAPLIVAILIIAIFLGPPYYLVKYLADNQYVDSLRFIDATIAVISILIIIFIGKFLSKRTDYGNELYGKTKGFKNFLITAKKEQLEDLVMQNPTYFYDILPYTYALGISKKWVKKFENIALKAPSWTDSSDSFNINSFEKFMDSTMSSVHSSMTSRPSSDSSGGGGFSSGGGSSGGGSGGGGGSSW